MTNELYHHGIKGQKWGVRRFQNKQGGLTTAGRRRYSDTTRNETGRSSTVSSAASASQWIKSHKKQIAAGSAIAAAAGITILTVSCSKIKDSAKKGRQALKYTPQYARLPTKANTAAQALDKYRKMINSI